ncbi:LOW QUALITY PROTEIN: hypothetical protein T265_14065 [Opisthorchis viverrini]|uniref:Uncharacterized protein n=1 Tax=Opisthorchis viverrini TaxID=6198 RepID=A0A075ADM3_OPIVI|nr:LOW QUALITY PROTEIN: hypothetical protein T265_14065 [Opisthorchis viverrini]KER26134.1 LOW QUALITY PROTEIN: hypothetical protein T265_14065 [Opisthorchis viverrini]
MSRILMCLHLQPFNQTIWKETDRTNTTDIDWSSFLAMSTANQRRDHGDPILEGGQHPNPSWSLAHPSAKSCAVHLEVCAILKEARKTRLVSKKPFSCSTLSVPSCHATRREHEGWGAGRLPRPRQGKSRGRGRVRTTDLAVTDTFSGSETTQRLERKFTDRKVRGSNPTSACRLPLSRLGHPGSIPALVLSPCDMASRHRKGATSERFILFYLSDPNWTVFKNYTNLQINLVFTRESTEPLLYDVLQLNALNTGRLVFQLRCSRYRSSQSLSCRTCACKFDEGQCIRDEMVQVSANLLTARFAVRTRPLPRLGQPGSSPALLLPSGGMAVKHRKSATAVRFGTTKTLRNTTYR